VKFALTSLLYDHGQLGSAISSLRTPDLLRGKPDFIGQIGDMPDRFAGPQTLKVAVPLATDQGPAHIHRGDVVSSVGNALIIATILNGRQFFESWIIVYGTVDAFSQAGTLLSSTDRRSRLGHPALLQAPMLVAQRRLPGNSAYTPYERAALEVVGAQLYLSERLIVGASGLTEKQGEGSGAYEHLSPILDPLRPLLRRSYRDDCGQEAEDEGRPGFDIGPADRVYRFLLRTGSPLVTRLYGPVFAGTTRSAGNKWLSVGRDMARQSGTRTSRPHVVDMIGRLRAAVNTAVNALSRPAAAAQLHLKFNENAEGLRPFSGTIDDAIADRLVSWDKDAAELDIAGLTQLAFYWDLDPSQHFPQLHFWSSHFAAARFLGTWHRHRGEAELMLPPAAHWGLQALSSTMFEGLLDHKTVAARKWLRGFEFASMDIEETQPARIRLPVSIEPSWRHRIMRKPRGRP